VLLLLLLLLLLLAAVAEPCREFSRWLSRWSSTLASRGKQLANPTVSAALGQSETVQGRAMQHGRGHNGAHKSITLKTSTSNKQHWN
jgi:hypothetical protein